MLSKLSSPDRAGPATQPRDRVLRIWGTPAAFPQTSLCLYSLHLSSPSLATVSVFLAGVPNSGLTSASPVQLGDSWGESPSGPQVPLGDLAGARVLSSLLGTGWGQWMDSCGVGARCRAGSANPRDHSLSPAPSANDRCHCHHSSQSHRRAVRCNRSLVTTIK